MAKRKRRTSKVTDGAKEISVQQADDVRRIRDRYAHALALGWPVKEASALANGDRPLVKPGTTPVPTKSVPTEPTKQETAPPKVEAIPEGDSVGVAERPPVEIPPNWEDLPWPQLRELSQAVSGQTARSRREAEETIRTALDVKE